MKVFTVQVTDHHNNLHADLLIDLCADAVESVVDAYQRAHPEADFMTQTGYDDRPDELRW